MVGADTGGDRVFHEGGIVIIHKHDNREDGFDIEGAHGFQPIPIGAVHVDNDDIRRGSADCIQQNFAVPRQIDLQTLILCLQLDGKRRGTTAVPVGDEDFQDDQPGVQGSRIICRVAKFLPSVSRQRAFGF